MQNLFATIRNQNLIYKDVNLTEKVFLKITSIVILCLFLTNCAQQEMLDLSRLNHPGMDFSREKKFTQSSPLSNLDEFESTSGGGGCSTCAK